MSVGLRCDLHETPATYPSARETSSIHWGDNLLSRSYQETKKWAVDGGLYLTQHNFNMVLASGGSQDSDRGFDL